MTSEYFENWFTWIFPTLGLAIEVGWYDYLG